MAVTDEPAEAGGRAGHAGGETLHWHIGDVRVTRVGELITPAPRHMLLPDVTDEQLEDTSAWTAPYFTDGHIRLSFHTFIVESSGRTVVVDTCLGDNPVRVMPGDATFPDRVAAEIDGGLDAVDLVLCTHLHFDHVGWNTRMTDGIRVPTFPNARYLFTRQELEFLDAEDHHEVREDDIDPLLEAGLVDIIETRHQLTEELRTVPTPGHTPGHVSLLIESGEDRAVITGDAVHSPIQFRYPDIAATPFDWDSMISTETRRALVDQYLDSDALILGTHFAPPTAGHIRTGEHGVWFDDRLA